MPELNHFTIDSSGDIEQAILDDGACIVDSLLSADLCDALMSDFLPHIENASWNNSEYKEDKAFFGLKTIRFHGLASLSDRCADIVGNEFLLDLASSLLGRGKRCRALRVSTMELIVLGNGQGNQQLHRDMDSWAFLDRSREENLLFSANIALCDFTSTNGATIVVPGSHKWPDERQATEVECCLATMKKGSALLYSGDVVHGGGNNDEDAIRTGFYIGFIPSWLSHLENQMVSNKVGIIESLDERVQHLLNVVPGGFSVIP